MNGQTKGILKAYRDAANTPGDAQNRLWDRISDSIDAGAVPALDVGPASEAASVGVSSSGSIWGGWISWTIATLSVVGVTTVIATSMTATSSPDPTKAPTREPQEAAVVSPAPRRAPMSVPRQAPVPVPHQAPTPVGPSLQPAPALSVSRRAPTRAVRPQTARATPRVEPVVTRVSTGLSAELAILRRAEASLAAGQWQVALEHLASHRRQFPEAQLKQERAALRIRALCAGGKRPQARGEAHVFLRRWPASAHADHIRGLCREPSSRKPSGVGTAR